MATQTTGAQTFVKASVDISSDNSAWTEIDGHGASVAVTTGARNAPEQHTFQDETPVVKGGARAATEVEVRFIYTETSAEPFEVARAIFEAEGGECYVRYSPLSDDTGNERYSTGKAIMTDFVYPQGDAEGNEIIMGGFTVKAAELTQAEIA
jgi:hypothetical protein